MHSVLRSSFRFACRLSILSVVLSVAAAQAAPTSYSDDFSGAMHGWAPDASYHLTQQDGTLVLDVAKQTRWSGQWLELGGATLTGMPARERRLESISDGLYNWGQRMPVPTWIMRVS